MSEKCAEISASLVKAKFYLLLLGDTDVKLLKQKLLLRLQYKETVKWAINWYETMAMASDICRQ